MVFPIAFDLLKIIVSHSNYSPQASWTTLQQRAKIIDDLRRFFQTRGFTEVETPILSHDTVVDRYLNPITVTAHQVGVANESQKELYLQTSPEFGMKRLLAAGAERIYQICKAFRSGERGAWHNPEFTMLEWYEVGVDYRQGQQRLIELAEAMIPNAPCRVITYQNLMLEVCDLDPFLISTQQLAAKVQSMAPESAETAPAGEVGALDRDGWLNLLMGSLVEDYLRQQANVIVCDWPASQAALAQVRQTTVGPVAERFEWYFQGVELANGYHELLDAAILWQRNQTVNQLRVAQGDSPLPSESRLLQAMRAGLPNSCGCALGVDRLVACLLHADSIDQVIAFPWERA